MKELTIATIENSLIEGLEYNEEQRKQIHDYLCNMCERMTLEEINEKCWEDSDTIFQEIFGS